MEKETNSELPKNSMCKVPPLAIKRIIYLSKIRQLYRLKNTIAHIRENNSDIVKEAINNAIARLYVKYYAEIATITNQYFEANP
jgi:hypothetical protein